MALSSEYNGGHLDTRQPEDPKSSDFCEPCLVGNDHKNAVGWCETCDEMLCNNCYKGHCNLKITKDHVLMSLEKMRSYKRIQRVPTTCVQHGGKPLEYYCESHKCLGCHACYVKEHRECRKIVRLNDVTSSENEKIKQLQKKLSCFGTRVKLSKLRASKARDTASKQSDEAIFDIMRAKTEMNNFIERLVDAKIAETQKFNEATLTIIQVIEQISEEVEEKLKTATENLEFLTGEGNQRLLFINMKSIELTLHELESKIQEAELLDIRGIKFALNTHLARIMKQEKEIGTFERTNVCRVESATEIEKEVHELKFKKSCPICPEACLAFPEPRNDKFEVSVNKDINLSHFIVCKSNYMVVKLGIFEGNRRLVECIHYGELRPGAELEVVQHGRGRGVILQAGHTYKFTAEAHICCSGQANTTMTVGGVTFTFTSLQGETTVDTGLIEGLKFTLA